MLASCPRVCKIIYQVMRKVGVVEVALVPDLNIDHVIDTAADLQHPKHQVASCTPRLIFTPNTLLSDRDVTNLFCGCLTASAHLCLEIKTFKQYGLYSPVRW